MIYLDKEKVFWDKISDSKVTVKTVYMMLFVKVYLYLYHHLSALGSYVWLVKPGTRLVSRH